MLKRALIVAFAAMLSLAALAGCSSNESKSQGESKDAGSQPTTQETTPANEGSANGETAAADSNPADAINVVMTVTDADGNEVANVAVQTAPDAMVFDVLEDSNVEFLSETGDYGPFVTSINGIDASSAGDNAGWVFTLNGEPVMVGCDQQPVADGDVVAWELTTF